MHEKSMSSLRSHYVEFVDQVLMNFELSCEAEPVLVPELTLDFEWHQ